MKNQLTCAVIEELAAALAGYERLPCRPSIAEEDGVWTLTVSFGPFSNATQALHMLELKERLQRVEDVAQIRGFAERYGIDAERLEGLLASAEDVRPPAKPTLTLEELTAVVSALEDEHLLVEAEQDDRIMSALPKLRAQLAAEIF